MSSSRPSENYVGNPSAELDLGGWSTSADPSTLTRVPGGVKGAWQFKLRTPDGISSNAACIGPTFKTPTVVTLSAWCRTEHTNNPAAPAAVPVLACHDDGPHFVYTAIPDDGVRRRLSVTWTAPAGRPQTIAISDPRLVHSDVTFDGVMLQLGSTMTEYVDGDQAGCRWDGGPHASVSRRAGLAETDQSAMLASYGGSPPAYGPGQTSVQNAGTAPAEPVVLLEGAPTGWIYALWNVATGAVLSFAPPGLLRQANERITIDARPEHRGVWSNVRGSLTHALAAGTNDVGGFLLRPGANTIALHTQAASCIASMWWCPRYASAA